MKKVLYYLSMIILFFGCKTKINYYHGHIFNQNDSPAKDLKVYEKNNKEKYSKTDTTGYFKIDIENNEISRFLIIESNDKVIDSIQVIGTQGGEKIIFSFIEGRKDTLYIKSNKNK